MPFAITSLSIICWGLKQTALRWGIKWQSIDHRMSHPDASDSTISSMSLLARDDLAVMLGCERKTRKTFLIDWKVPNATAWFWYDAGARMRPEKVSVGLSTKVQAHSLFHSVKYC